MDATTSDSAQRRDAAEQRSRRIASTTDDDDRDRPQLLREPGGGGGRSSSSCCRRTHQDASCWAGGWRHLLPGRELDYPDDTGPVCTGDPPAPSRNNPTDPDSVVLSPAAYVAAGSVHVVARSWLGQSRADRMAPQVHLFRRTLLLGSVIVMSLHLFDCLAVEAGSAAASLRCSP